MKNVFLILALAFSTLLAACGGGSTSADQQQRVAQERLSEQSNAEVGMPAIVNFQEKRTLKDIYEMRDKALTTYTYTQDREARLHLLCNSIGYGIPYATQYTNPQRVVGDSYHTLTTVPQPDPNGLFSPADAEGTWVLCLDPTTKKVSPVYAEPRIVVSQFPLN